jgi:hypothetical protein
MRGLFGGVGNVGAMGKAGGAGNCGGKTSQSGAVKSGVHVRTTSAREEGGGMSTVLPGSASLVPGYVIAVLSASVP